MAYIKETLYDINIISITVRLILATICGGIIGLERGKKKRPAGFRTHILVCLGSAIAMMTNQFIVIQFETASDPARLGAQVISGIGFLGVGTIIVKGRHQVKGLTTAAGLWASACMGLAIGIGFYEGAIVACFFIIFVTSLLHSLDNYVQSKSKVAEAYIEFETIQDVSIFISSIKPFGMKVEELDFCKTNTPNDKGVGVMMTLRLENKMEHDDIMEKISQIQGVVFAELI